jgi:DNA topoisomerase I
MAKNLVIVESPAKAKTISRFLGSEYKVLASMGHIRDLPKSKTGVDVENDFEPQYEISADKKKTVKLLKDEVKDGTVVWVATDEDREGEAIGWHLLSALKVNAKKNPVKRIVFHEITKSAIEKAIETPREIDQNLVDAQQARRVLDRLVGYELSPLLWRKVRKGLSAGRVQSVAVRLVVEREREIKAFKPEEFWKIKGQFSKKEADQFGRKDFEAVLEKSADGKKLANEKITTEVFDKLKDATYKIGSVEKKDVKRNPAAPFITSTLQQEASRKLGFSVKKTMVIAQKLYEGIDIGGGERGLITYMRTDSVNLADLALKQARDIVTEKYGAEFALSEPRKYKGRKGAQDAHEAIRPVDLSVLPEDVKGSVEKDLYRLYELIWKRTIACQMKQALLNRVKVSVLPVAASGAEADFEGLSFGATGQTIEFPGFMKVYMEGKDEGEENGDDDDKILPALEVEEDVDCAGTESSQHFTKPPARYTEASLVKKLESEGIGRPSTYAPTISTIQNRGYIEKNAKQLVPTEVADIVTDVLVEHFSDIVDYKFTAHMEEQLDDIAEGKKQWVPVMKDFYGPFHQNLTEKMESIKREDVVHEETDEVCEKCGKPMTVKLGRFGKFLSCSDYPECKNAKPYETPASSVTDVVKDAEMEVLEKEHAGKKCEKCGADMAIRNGRFGKFLGCTAYPKCKTIVSLDGKSNSTGVKCPACEKNDMVEKRTRRGKIFWGCGGYPKCKFASWDKPLRNEEQGGKKGIVTEKKGEEVFVAPEEDAKDSKKGK